MSIIGIETSVGNQNEKFYKICGIVEIGTLYSYPEYMDFYDSNDILFRVKPIVLPSSSWEIRFGNQKLRDKAFETIRKFSIFQIAYGELSKSHFVRYSKAQKEDTDCIILLDPNLIGMKPKVEYEREE